MYYLDTNHIQGISFSTNHGQWFSLAGRCCPRWILYLAAIAQRCAPFGTHLGRDGSEGSTAPLPSHRDEEVRVGGTLCMRCGVMLAWQALSLWSGEYSYLDAVRLGTSLLSTKEGAVATER